MNQRFSGLKTVPKISFCPVRPRALLAAFLLLLPPAAARSQILPESYDLRSIGISPGVTVSWVSAIQDQGNFNDCWTFASATAINSNLLKNGYFTTSSTAPAIQISSWHLSTANGVPESVIGPDYSGEDGNYDWGGFEYQALGYLTRGSGQWAIPGVPSSPANGYLTAMGGGVVLNSQNPQNSFPSIFDSSTPANISHLIPPSEQNIAFQTRQVVMFDQGFSNNVALPAPISPGGSSYNFTQGAADPQVAAVKAGILQYGAVTTSMNAAEYSYFHFEANGNGSYTVNYFNPSKDINNTDHEVTIIGWDDNYVMTNPHNGEISTGAWIVQNSWGSNYWTGSDNPNDGTFRVSYNDAVIGRAGVAAFQMEATGAYSQKVLQNELGPMGYANNYQDGQGPLGMAVSEFKTVASVLTPDENGSLIALGVATQKAGVGLTIRIYADLTSMTEDPNNPLSSQTFTLSGIGYQLLDLENSVDLFSGDSIVVQLEYSETDSAAIVIGGSGLNGYLDVPAGLSYYHDGSDSTWKDFSTMDFSAYGGSDTAHGGVLFLKGITAVPEPPVCLLAFAGMTLLMATARCRHSSGGCKAESFGKAGA